jgi:phage tail protein X
MALNLFPDTGSLRRSQRLRKGRGSGNGANPDFEGGLYPKRVRNSREKGRMASRFDNVLPGTYHRTYRNPTEGERTMGLFGKSFEVKVENAVAGVMAENPGVKNLRAEVDGKVVILRGDAPDLEAKARAMSRFNALVDTENTINKIQIPAPAAEAPAPSSGPVETEIYHLVVAGDTLSALAKRYYGKSSEYLKIFEANRNILTNPDLIRVGQKLRIPK